MPTLGRQDLKDVLLVANVALSCTEIEDLKHQVLRCLMTVFQSDHSACALAGSSFNELDYERTIIIYQGTYSQQKNVFITPYLERYRHLDPYNRRFPFLPPVSTKEDVALPEELETNEYYNDFLRPHAIEHMMCLLLKSGNRVLGRLSVGRSRHTGNYTSREKAKAELMVPILSRVLEEKMLLEERKGQIELLKSLNVDLVSRGMVILNQALEPVYADEEGERILFSFKAAGKFHEGSPVFPQEELYRHCRELHTLSREQDYPRVLERRLILNAGRMGKPMTVLLRLVRSSPWPPVFVVCFDPDYPGRTLTQSLVGAGLTRREREIAGLILEGLENTEVCDRLFISAHTLETHLKSIHRKLNVHSRTGLFHRLMSLA
jgi:DNA-binding CsgD family transcriptional regulator